MPVLQAVLIMCQWLKHCHVLCKAKWGRESLCPVSNGCREQEAAAVEASFCLLTLGCRLDNVKRKNMCNLA